MCVTRWKNAKQDKAESILYNFMVIRVFTIPSPCHIREYGSKLYLTPNQLTSIGGHDWKLTT